MLHLCQLHGSDYNGEYMGCSPCLDRIFPPVSKGTNGLRCHIVQCAHLAHVTDLPNIGGVSLNRCIWFSLISKLVWSTEQERCCVFLISRGFRTTQPTSQSSLTKTAGCRSHLSIPCHNSIAGGSEGGSDVFLWEGIRLSWFNGIHFRVILVFLAVPSNTFCTGTRGNYSKWCKKVCESYGVKRNPLELVLVFID